MMKLILLTALLYQPLYPNDGTQGASMLETAAPLTEMQTLVRQPVGQQIVEQEIIKQTPTLPLNVSQLEAEIALELDKQLKALHAELPQQGTEQALLASQSR